MRAIGDRRDGRGRDRDALEEIEVDAERRGDGRLDRVGVADGDDRLTAVARDDPPERADDARLHLDERLAARETEAARMPLDGLPLGPSGGPPERSAGPLADIQLEEPALHAEREAPRPSDRRPGFARPLER